MAAEPQTAPVDDLSLLGSRLRVPRNVVYRTFPSETVLLNLDTGRYHGLNVTAGRVLGVLEGAPSVREAVGELSREYRLGPAEVRVEVCSLCRALLQRGLVELDDAGPD
jgi:Coenzyme PQQ synthesis protein D (PqqD)